MNRTARNVRYALIGQRGKYLLTPQQSTKTNQMEWRLPGTNACPGESPKSTLDRVLKEQLNVSLEYAEPLLTERQRGLDGEPITVEYYAAMTADLSAEKRPIPDAVRWVALDEWKGTSDGTVDAQLLELLAATDRKVVWDRVWAGDPYASADVRKQRSHSKFEVLAKQGLKVDQHTSLLEIGCGAGYNLWEIARRFPNVGQLSGCDMSDRALAAARDTLESAGVRAELTRADARFLPYDDASFDCVVALGVLEHVPDAPTLLAEVHRVVRPGGKIFFSTSSTLSFVFWARKIRERLGVWQYGFQRNYSPSAFHALISTRFHIDGTTVVQTGFDFPVEATLDRAINQLNPAWGRYIVMSVTKEG